MVEDNLEQYMKANYRITLELFKEAIVEYIEKKYPEVKGEIASEGWKFTSSNIDFDISKVKEDINNLLKIEDGN